MENITYSSAEREPLVTVLMATYNGEQFVGEQIESILQQSYKNWKLVIHDDGSSDNTLNIVGEYSKQNSNITILKDDRRFGSSYRNFMHLVKNCPETDYVMFCDQDDIWKKDKIKNSLLFLTNNKNYNESAPGCVFTDYELYDSDKKEIIAERKAEKEIREENLRFKQLLFENCVHGCTMLMNRALINLLAKWNYFDYGMHDWTAGLVAAYYDQLYYLDEKTMLYRQHKNNVLGARKGFGKWLFSRTSYSKNKTRVKTYYAQAGEILKICGNDAVGGSNYLIAKEVAGITQKNKFRKAEILLKKGYLRGNIVKRIGIILFT